MKNKIPMHLLVVTLIMLIFISCGPGKKLLLSEAKVDALEKANSASAKQLYECDNQLNSLKLEKTNLLLANARYQDDLSALTTSSDLTIADQAKRLKNLQEIIQTQKNAMTTLKSSLTDALVKYGSDELTVYFKDGNVHVALQEKLLFKSGSDVVDPKGKEALKSLSEVLNNAGNITVLIEGHTDNIPIKTKVYKDNWDLSTARATAIVRILTADFGFDSNRITASGKGKFHPVNTNESVEGRAGNRRTEVILSPDMKELYSLLNQ
ncbi:MAG: OmpA family protein [Bacteroidales bacterium]|nr:OmpA family protein [Bacteroidales bacterium]